MNRRYNVFDFFTSTRIAGRALVTTCNCKPYFNWAYHFDAIVTFTAHLFRAVYNIASFIASILATPIYIIPFFWLGLPKHILSIPDYFVGFVISVATAAIAPVIFVLRTVSTLIFGYGVGFDVYQEEDEDINFDYEISVFNY